MTPQNQITKFKFSEVIHVRSYVVDMETEETIHLDRVNASSKDIALALEKLAFYSPKATWLWISNDTVTLKLTENWKVSLSRDGAVVIKVPDCALIVDEKILLLCVDEDGLYAPVAKAETVTWDGTEEYFAPADIRRLVKETIKRILQLAHWL